MCENISKKYYLLNAFIERHNDIKSDKCYRVKRIDDTSFKLVYGDSVILESNFFDIYNYLYKKYVKNTFRYRGKDYYLGLVSLLDGTIEEVVSIDRVYTNYARHYLFLERGQYDRVENGESSLFFVYKGKVTPYNNTYIPSSIIEKIEKEITIL